MAKKPTREGRLSDVAAIQNSPARDGRHEHFSMSIRPIENGHIVTTSHDKDGTYCHKERFMAERPVIADVTGGRDVGAGDESIKSAVDYLNR
jgi:hypothetical protein